MDVARTMGIKLRADPIHVQRPDLPVQVLQRGLRQSPRLEEHPDRITLDRDGGQRADAGGD